MFGSSKNTEHECTGTFGVVEDEDGNPTEGIEMHCDGYDADPIVVPGSEKEAERKADEWLEEHGMTARIDI